MRNEDLIRKLNSVGKAAFVENFALLKSHADGHISRQRCIDSLVAKGVSNTEGASIRAGNAATIFRAAMEYEALNLVLDSTRLPSTVIQTARQILGGRAK
jgi:hypothetical protein